MADLAADLHITVITNSITITITLITKSHLKERTM
jgi:DeoR/GlpR family transcriptional regulator of sugar metabolism